MQSLHKKKNYMKEACPVLRKYIMYATCTQIAGWSLASSIYRDVRGPKAIKFTWEQDREEKKRL